MHDEKTLIKWSKEGVAKYMFKNIKRKQKLIDEKFSILAKNKQKQQALTNRNISKHHKQEYEYFFSPSFLKSCIQFENSMLKKERVNQIKRLAFGISLNGLLDEFLSKDTMNDHSNSQIVVGKIIEPLHLNDHVLHQELEQQQQRKISQKRQSAQKRPSTSPNQVQQRKKRSLYPSTSPHRHGIKQSISPNSVTRCDTVKASTLTQQKYLDDVKRVLFPETKSPGFPKMHITPEVLKSQLSYRIQHKQHKHNINENDSPNFKSGESPIRLSPPKKSPSIFSSRVKTPKPQNANYPLQNINISNNLTPNRQQSNYKTRFNYTSRITPQPIKRQSYNNTQKLPSQERQTIQSRISRFNLVHQHHQAHIQNNKKSATPSKNTVQTRDISGSKGRMKMLSSTSIKNIKIDHENINITEKPHTMASRVRESIVKKPVFNPFISIINSPKCHVSSGEATEDYSVTLNILRDGLKGLNRTKNDQNTASTCTLQSMNNKQLTQRAENKSKLSKYLLPKLQTENMPDGQILQRRNPVMMRIQQLQSSARIQKML